MNNVRIALAQINTTVGDLAGNCQQIERGIEVARHEGAALVAFGELTIPGYPPEDLLLKRSFIADNRSALERVKRATSGIAAVVGFVDEVDGAIYNAAALIAHGEVVGIYHKQHLPNYGVFDERRYFTSGSDIVLAKIGELVFGVTICEDLWDQQGPHLAASKAGATLILNINASPYHMGKGNLRAELLQRRVSETGAGFAYVNIVGGQDELVFDGQSCVYASDGTLVSRAEQFKEEMLLLDWPVVTSQLGATTETRVVDLGTPNMIRPQIDPRIASGLASDPEAYAALVLGVRDYLGKNGFTSALVGLSGGIDSALTAAIAVDALGPASVLGISNTSEYTSQRSLTGAEQLAKNLGMDLLTIPIKDAYETVLKALDPVFSGTESGIAEENIQARIRGLIWMAISNKTSRLVLSTGNKSEMSVGYATLYGDMAGGLAVLKDVPKTLVYRLARWRNWDRTVIPQDIIDRPPSAELRPDQLDTDSLPPYETLDPILEAYVEDDLSIAEIIALGFDEAVVKRVAGLVDRAEYKRRQAPPGIKITDRAFGRDRRLPITNAYRPYHP